MITQQSGDLYSTPGSDTGPRGRVEQASKALSPGVVTGNPDRGQPPGRRAETGVETPRGRAAPPGSHRAPRVFTPRLLCLGVSARRPPSFLSRSLPRGCPSSTPAGVVSPEESGLFVRWFGFFFCLFVFNFM